MNYDKMVEAAFAGRNVGIVRHSCSFDAAGRAIRLVLAVPSTWPGDRSGQRGRRSDRSALSNANGIVDHAAIMAT